MVNYILAYNDKKGFDVFRIPKNPASDETAIKLHNNTDHIFEIVHVFNNEETYLLFYKKNNTYILTCNFGEGKENILIFNRDFELLKNTNQRKNHYEAKIMTESQYNEKYQNNQN